MIVHDSLLFSKSTYAELRIYSLKIEKDPYSLIN